MSFCSLSSVGAFVSKTFPGFLFTVALVCWGLVGAGCDREAPPAPDAAVQILSTLLNDPDVSVRRTAAEALGKIGDRGTERLLISALRDSDALVREAAARSMGRFPVVSKEAGAELASLLQDAHLSVRQAAAEAFVSTEGSPALATSLSLLLASPDVTIRQSAAHALLLVDTREASVAEALARATQDTDPAVRRWAVAALAESGDSAVGPILLDRLMNDSSEEVRIEAAYRLRFIGNGSAVSGLETAGRREGNVDVTRWGESSLAALRKVSDSGSTPRPNRPASTAPSGQYP